MVPVVTICALGARMNGFDSSPIVVVEDLVGRRRELDFIRAFIARAVTRGDALLVLGEPGVGKTALLDVAAHEALDVGAQVLSARGVEFEAEMSFSSLNQTLVPLFASLGELTAAHRDALHVALGLGDGSPPDRLVVSSATLALLRQAAAERPLLVIIDDLQWLDRASAGVLAFVARRLAGSTIGFLAASRLGEESFFDRAGLPELELQSLDANGARKLVDEQFPTLARSVRDRILAEAQGNPLALLELPAALSIAQQAALEALPGSLPLSRRLQALFASRIKELPEPSRQLLLSMALDGAGELRVLDPATDVGARLGDLAAAERARLAHVDRTTRRPAFRHPLIRSTVVELSTADERSRAHLELAELWADQPDRRAWHLAEATGEPDERVAEQLEQAAYRTLRRGDGVGAVSMLTRAADLSPRGVDRGRRLAEAAHIGADVTGELRNASQLLDDAHRADPRFTESLQAAATAAFVLLNGEGDVETAHRLLVGAIENSQHVSAAALEEALHVLALLCFFGGRAELWAAFDRALGRLEPNVPTTLYLVGTCFADPVYKAAAALPRLERAIADLAAETDPTVILKVAFAAGNTDRLSPCRPALWRVARGGLATGSMGAAIQALVVLTFDSWYTGRWDEAEQLAAEAIELCDAHGFPLFAFSVRHARAAVAAARGDDAAVEEIVNAMLQWAAPRGAGFVHPVTCQVRSLASLGRGEFEDAYRFATAISPAGTLPSHELMVHWVLMDVVEAAVHTGRHDEAVAHVAAMREANVVAISPRVALFAHGAAAMAAPDDAAVELFEKAISSPGANHWPFYLARVELAYGERLRRLRATTEARSHLTAALETFERLAARHWADRAAAELRASGKTRPRAFERDRDALTPQEREIAMLAAAGESNKEIGQRLFLSPRTVGNHLFRIYPKLGITSRAALRDALGSLPLEQESPPRS